MKLRHNPNKPQNRYGSTCDYFEIVRGKEYCECGCGDTNICKGNRHNCIKVKYHKLATRSDKQKIEENKELKESEVK